MSHNLIERPKNANVIRVFCRMSWASFRVRNPPSSRMNISNGIRTNSSLKTWYSFHIETSNERYPKQCFEAKTSQIFSRIGRIRIFLHGRKMLPQQYIIRSINLVRLSVFALSIFVCIKPFGFSFKKCVGLGFYIWTFSDKRAYVLPRKKSSFHLKRPFSRDGLGRKKRPLTSSYQRHAHTFFHTQIAL